MRVQMIYLFTVLTVASMLVSSIKVYGDGMQILEDKAIEIANKEAKKLGYSIEDMKVKATHYNTPLNEYLSDSEEDYYVERRNKLKNKGYWTIYYYNPKFKKGGDLCIFIDSSNGDVITYIRGK